MRNLLKTAAYVLLAAAVMALTACEIGGNKNNNKNGLFMLLGLAGSADTTAPAVTAFALTSPGVTARRSIHFTLDAADNVGVTAYLVSESAAKPAADDAAWSAEKPAAFSVSEGYADKTVYAYAKDAAGNVSDGASLSVRYVQPGTEDMGIWDRKFDGNNNFDIANSIAVDAKGNVYVAGCGTNLVSGTSNSDWWIKKFDANGTEDTANWDKRFDGNNNYDVLPSIAVDADGNVYVAGFGTNLVSDASGADWWIKKFDANGVEDTVNWNKKIDNNNGNDTAHSIAVDADGNVYLAGIGVNLVSGTSSGDWWIKKFYGE